VIPETLVGIIVFTAGVGPGYLFVQLAERYGPRRDRSQLEEAAELLVVGSAATAGSLLFVSMKAGGVSSADCGVVCRRVRAVARGECVDHRRVPARSPAGRPERAERRRRLTAAAAVD
jgi:hypothetical protein